MFDEPFQRRLIYIFAIDDDTHRGLLKIGDTTLKSEKNLRQSAEVRIKQYTNTAGVEFELLHTELALRDDGRAFRDYDVHRLLKKYRRTLKGTSAREWFKVDLATAIKAIKAVKRDRRNLKPENFSAIIFRPEQLDAITRTVKYLRHNKNFLWNAKMRFGKTLCALEVVRRMNFSKTIILTHRPAVSEGWLEDFRKIFHGTDYIYLDKNYSLDGKENFVYFASLQDLRGSELVGGNFDKNKKIFETAWDFVIVDEAHEGTQTALGDTVIKNIVKENSKFLALSGTPFNILDDFDAENIYTWDYIMEQRAKKIWAEENLDGHNPYEDLPAMKIFTYNLGELFNYVDTEDKAFGFREFFKSDGEIFAHEDDVKNFLALMTEADNYPFSRADYRELFKHTLWIIPGVKEGRALSKLLKRHKIFCGFEIVNVAGNGDYDDEPADALEKVKNAIASHERTITLSCGKLTTGVTVPEWTAVFMLAGSYSTSAANYLQTIFRVQSPCNRGGFVKENCFVFDFAPDRTLKMLAEGAAISTRAGKTQDSDRQTLDALLKFCPVIAMSGSRMENYNTDTLLQQLKHVYVDRAVRNGFGDTTLYNDELLRLDALELDNFKTLHAAVGSSKAQSKINDIILNAQGLTDNEKISAKPPRSTEGKILDQQKKFRRVAISILRGISIRMPLLIYGADVPLDKDFKIEMLFDIDDASWEEFMPKGLTKEMFRNFIKYYDRDIFVAAAKKIRRLAKSTDDLTPTERINKIAELFATFKNPDKETVLTPWKVVKLHVDSAFDEKFFTHDKKILEINSKTGLYPLYVALKIYRTRLGVFDEADVKLEALQRIWDGIIAENLFVLCKTPMAVKITQRTLLGFRSGSVNAKFFDNLIDTLKTNPAEFVRQITDNSFWNKGVGNMFFDAVVGNPPYQNAMTNTSDEPIYNYFLETSFKLAKKSSLIHPARCLFNAGKTPKDFNQRLLANEHLKIVKYFPNSQEVFPSSDIKGGVAITLYDANENFGAIGTFIPFAELKLTHQRVVLDDKNFKPLSEIIYPPEIYHFTKKFHEDNPRAAKLLSDGHADDLTTNIFDKLPKIFLSTAPNDGHEYIQIYGLANKQRAFKWIRREWITEHESFAKWKVFVPKSNGSGALGERVSTPLVGSPLVGSPLVGATQTFITVGAFDSEAEAQACIAYIRSKFCRVMLGILKVTQHNPPATWAKVPLQDFTSTSDIDWRGNIDEQLYRKYNLTAAEIEFIESHVRAMT